MKLNPPENPDLPFFTYGLFRPGQLAFFQIREFVEEVDEPVEIRGHVLVRDGLPILVLGQGHYPGALLSFAPQRAADDNYIKSLFFVNNFLPLPYNLVVPR